MITVPLIWALWIGPSSGYIENWPPKPVAYFAIKTDCEQVEKMLEGRNSWSKCIGAHYVVKESNDQDIK